MYTSVKSLNIVLETPAKVTRQVKTHRHGEEGRGVVFTDDVTVSGKPKRKNSIK